MFQTAERKPVSNAHGRVVTGRRPVYDEAGECIGSVNGAGGVYDTDGVQIGVAWPNGEVVDFHGVRIGHKQLLRHTSSPRRPR